MGTKDPRIDAHIAKSAEFARPILARVREAVHAGCPGVEETLKWGAPAFLHHGILLVMAAFKAHVSVHFWKGSLLRDAAGRRVDEALGLNGRITGAADLPSRAALVRLVRQAAKLNATGTGAPKAKKPARKPLPVPPDFRAALAKNQRASAAFAKFPPGRRREYVEWILDAKREETRARRIAQAVKWIAEGKSRNWKYEAC